MSLLGRQMREDSCETVLSLYGNCQTVLLKGIFMVPAYHLRTSHLGDLTLWFVLEG